MKIGIDGRTLMDARYSGVSWFVFHLLTALFQADNADEFALFYNSGSDVSGRVPDFGRSNVQPRHFHIPNKLFNYGLAKPFSRPKMDRLLETGNIFWPHLNFSPVSRRARVILTVHDLSFVRYPELFSLRKNIWHQLVNAKKLCLRADHIVAMSECTREDVIELFGIAPEKVTAIWPGLDEKFRAKSFNPDEYEAIRQKYRLPEKYILFFGTIEPRKNVGALIEAYGIARARGWISPNIKLVLAGGQGWKSRAIIKAWEQSPYQKDIIFSGYADDADKPAVYDLAKLFIFPSLYEGFGFPVIEAMARGIPAITSPISSLPEAAGNAALLINPRDPHDLAEAMSTALTDPNLRTHLITSGRQQAGKFAWNNTAEEYLRVFCRVFA